jgi:hypothetical protein
MLPSKLEVELDSGRVDEALVTAPCSSRLAEYYLC